MQLYGKLMPNSEGVETSEKTFMETAHISCFDDKYDNEPVGNAGDGICGSF